MKTSPYHIWKTAVCIATVLFFTLALAPQAKAQQQVKTSFPMLLRMQADVTTFDCNNSPGPRIEFAGDMTLGGMSVDLIFRNNINKDVHVHTESVVVNTVFLKAGEKIVIPKQPVRGGVGGNPFIWVQFLDGKDNPVGGEVFLGRCVQGAFKIDSATSVAINALANIAVLECANSPGPFIELDGDMTFGGLQVRYIFRNNDNPVGGPHEATYSTPIVLIPAGTHVKFPKQPVLGGVGGNPWISVLFRNGDGTPIGDEVLLGRCEQLSKSCCK